MSNHKTPEEIETELVQIEYFWKHQYKHIVDMKNLSDEGAYTAILHAERDVRFLLELLNRNSIKE